MIGNCPACGALGTPGGKCPGCGGHIPTAAEVARAVTAGARIFALLIAAHAAGHTVATDFIGGRLVLVEHYD